MYCVTSIQRACCRSHFVVDHHCQLSVLSVAEEVKVQNLGRIRCASSAPNVNFLNSNVLQVEPRAHLLGVCAPFPILPTRTLDTLVHTSELHREAWAQLLQTSSDLLRTLHRLAIYILDDLLCGALVPENVSVSSEEDVITLVVKCDDLSALDLRSWREERFEEVSGYNTQGCTEAVEDEFGEMAGGITVPGQLLARHEVGNAEVEHGSVGQEDNVESRRHLLVQSLVQDDHVCKVSCCGVL